MLLSYSYDFLFFLFFIPLTTPGVLQLRHPCSVSSPVLSFLLAGGNLFSRTMALCVCMCACPRRCPTAIQRNYVKTMLIEIAREKSIFTETLDIRTDWSALDEVGTNDRGGRMSASKITAALVVFFILFFPLWFFFVFLLNSSETKAAGGFCELRSEATTASSVMKN